MLPSQSRPSSACSTLDLVWFNTSHIQKQSSNLEIHHLPTTSSCKPPLPKYSIRVVVRGRILPLTALWMCSKRQRYVAVVRLWFWSLGDPLARCFSLLENPFLERIFWACQRLSYTKRKLLCMQLEFKKVLPTLIRKPWPNSWELLPAHQLQNTFLN